MIGERIRLARESLQLTQKDLASAANVPQSKISEIESGRDADPDEAVVAAVGKATNFPVGFFYQGPLPDLPSGHYRKLKRGTVKVSKQVRAQSRQVLELIQRAESQLVLPPVAITPVLEVDSLEQIELIAAEVRADLGLDDLQPIPNLTRAVERAGVVVVTLPTEMVDHDGFSAWPDFGMGGRPLIALARGNPGDRDRSNVAHELGHLVLHTRRLDVDSDRAEKEAHRFAGALLLPADAAVTTLRTPLTLSVLRQVKASYGVSMAMGAKRARDLGLISESHFVSLMKQLSARGWRKVEPDAVDSESPMLIAKIVDLLAGEGSLSTRAARVALPVFQFRSMTQG
jgi:Zn-dependent peptidase ImmA (M78 family)/DNA-binding XRE family transcriptional regulator